MQCLKGSFICAVSVPWHCMRKLIPVKKQGKSLSYLSPSCFHLPSLGIALSSYSLIHSCTHFITHSFLAFPF